MNELLSGSVPAGAGGRRGEARFGRGSDARLLCPRFSRILQSDDDKIGSETPTEVARNAVGVDQTKNS